MFDQVSRRQVLALSGGVALLGVCPPVFGRPALCMGPRARSLWLYNTHTGEFFKGTYWRERRYVQSALDKMNILLRDHRANKVKTIDKDVFDALFRLQQLMGYQKPFEIVSGYRTPNTNARLRRSGGGGVARNSYHIRGKAVDVRFKGLSLRRAHRAACALNVGGVGYYGSSSFIHLDVRGWPARW